MAETFHKLARETSSAVGRPKSFFIAVGIIAMWAASGPFFHFSDTWQLIINTGTTIVTFLMVFLIQNTQNRDSKAIHLKLDELLRANRAARNTLVDLENMTDAELEDLQGEFSRLRKMACDEAKEDGGLRTVDDGAAVPAAKPRAAAPAAKPRALRSRHR